MRAKRIELETDNYLLHLIKSEMIATGCVHPLDIFYEIKKEIPQLREKRFLRLFSRAAYLH